jgi:hypothetical protein
VLVDELCEAHETHHSPLWVLLKEGFKSSFDYIILIDICIPENLCLLQSRMLEVTEVLERIKTSQ